ncbi:MAG: ribbon-helix-helix domain-containing protein [bacterium]
MKQLIRKQIYLEEEMAEKIKKIASLKNTSQAEIIRSAVKTYLENNNITKNKDPLLKLIGIAETQIKDGSENHDKYLYGGSLDE